MTEDARPMGRAVLAALAFATLLAAAPAARGQTGTPAPAAGTPRALTLDEALRIAEGESEALDIARAGVTRARGEQYRARAELFPQISGSASYSRALRSEFQSLGGGGADTTQTGPTDCNGYTPNPANPLEQRVDSLEHAVDCAVNGNPFAGLGDLPFGRENTWRLGLNLSQTLFAGGRVRAQGRAAEAGRQRAEIALASQRAQLALDVTEAYYDAALADRLAGIAEATLAQAERTLRQTQLARDVGNQPEFDLLRATVARDNQRPVVIQRRADRDLAVLRLKQLLNLPLDQPVTLATPLGDEAVPVSRFATTEAPADSTDLRAPVRQAARVAEAQEQALRIARAQRFPTVRLTSDYGRVAYPEGAFPAWGDFRSNWTVGASLSVPIFTGGRIRGDVLVAQAGRDEALAQLRQTRELAALDTRTQLQRLATARAQWEASAGTVEQARRAYEIAEVRYNEGISTQVELADARILLQQAEANRASAARDYLVARARVELLADLPFDLAGAQAAAAQQLQQQQQQPSTTTQTQQQTPQGGGADQTQGGFSGTGGA